MSDPISVIATIVLAATGAIDNSDLPSNAKASAHAAVESGGDDAKSLAVQLGNTVAQLPEPAQQAARHGMAGAADQVASMLPPPKARTAQPDTSTARTGAYEHPLAIPATDTVGPRQSVNSHYPVSTTSFASIPVPEAAAIPSMTAGERIAMFVPWFRKAATVCSGIKAPTLAALYAAENGFRYGPDAPVSPAGARGPGQFMPGTWAVYGRDVHGTGAADIFDVGDSVMASAHLLCDNYQQIEAWKDRGLVAGDTLDLALAAYNAGAGAVLRSGGMPSGSADYEYQTKPYVARIRATENQYDWLDGIPDLLRPATDIGARIVDQALRYLGTPYVWGGGDIDGPTDGGFDCSGLTSYAVHAATGGTITLPRTSEAQWRIGTEIPLSQAQPGDLLFGGHWGSDGPGHVAIYLGGGWMVQAPESGDVVRTSPVMAGMRARRIG